MNGARQTSRVAFGATTAFDLATGGEATLDYRTSTGRHVAVILQALLWLAVLLVASNARWTWLRRRRRSVSDETGPVLRLGEHSAEAIPWVLEPDVVAPTPETAP